MSEMVERVARIIHPNIWLPSTEDRFVAAGCRDELVKNRQDSLQVARAAIAAMREPTEEMVQAETGVVSGHVRLQKYAANTWRVMIDKALE